MKYEETEETELLKSLKLKPNRQSVFKNAEYTDETSLNLVDFESEKRSEKSDERREKTIFINEKLKITINERDSDDDDDEFTPYDTSNDVPLSKTKQPAYLRDCLDGNQNNCRLPLFQTTFH